MPQSAERGTLYPDRLATKEKEYFIPQILPFPIEIGGDRLVALQTHHKINQGNPFVVHPLEEHEVSGVKNLTRETVETLTGLPQALIGNLRQAFVDREMSQLIVPVSLPDLRGVQERLSELGKRLEFSIAEQNNSDNSKGAYFNFGRLGEKVALGGAAALAVLAMAPAVPAVVQEAKETLGRVNLPQGYEQATKVVVDPLGRVMVELETAAAKFTVFAQEPGVEQPIEDPIEEPPPTPGPILSPEPGVEQPIEDPIEEPSPEPTPSPTEEGVEQPIEEPIEEPFPPQSYTVILSPDGLHGIIIPYPEQEGAIPLDGKDITIEATKPYTFYVRAYYGSSAELNFGVEETKNRIQQEIALTQQIFENSGAGNIHLVLEDIKSANYTSSGKLSEDLHRIMRSNDGYMDQVPIDRWEDKIHIIGYYDYYPPGGGCGWASLYSRLDVDFYSAEYYAVNINEPACSIKVTPHEIGHLFGLGESYHHGLFNNSLPYIDPGHGFMTYISTGVNCILCERREYYSNPNIMTPEGWPVGDDDHYNARAIQFTAPYKDQYFRLFNIFMPLIVKN